MSPLDGAKTWHGIVWQGLYSGDAASVTANGRTGVYLHFKLNGFQLHVQGASRARQSKPSRNTINGHDSVNVAAHQVCVESAAIRFGHSLYSPRTLNLCTLRPQPVLPHTERSPPGIPLRIYRTYSTSVSSLTAFPRAHNVCSTPSQRHYIYKHGSGVCSPSASSCAPSTREQSSTSSISHYPARAKHPLDADANSSRL